MAKTLLMLRHNVAMLFGSTNFILMKVDCPQWMRAKRKAVKKEKENSMKKERRKKKDVSSMKFQVFSSLHYYTPCSSQ